ncbi:hypothetical protein GO730_00295 [Spirosoma sp. HMF3257]|uniref:Helix-turn-helix domain-containing protein n=1 Tax=Spirosoma telluris TaxID=2183553 RepID=A0A327NH27_9BACT|nr:hypothetical protein [Spirosoma telluris]RAI73244.1 hypothetical protein HMF3257_00290 [Spirosoma telluris]
MKLVVNDQLGDRLLDVLERCAKHLEDSNAQIEKLQKELDRCRLMSESEAMKYLKRDANTLHHYQKHGLGFYKKGKEVWYTKGDIDDWLAKGIVNRRNGG